MTYEDIVHNVFKRPSILFLNISAGLKKKNMNLFLRSSLVNFMVLCVLIFQAHCQILETSSNGL